MGAFPWFYPHSETSPARHKTLSFHFSYILLKKKILLLKLFLLQKHPSSALGAVEQSLFLEQLCARAQWNAVGDELSYCSSSGTSAQSWVQSMNK